MKLRTQLFLLIAVLCLLMAVSASVFFRISIERGFAQYLDDREPPFLKTLTYQLEAFYQQHQSWEPLLPEWWTFVDRYAAPPGPPPEREIPPPESGVDNATPRRLPVFLLDAGRTLLAGTERAEPGTLLTPLRVNNEVVGWLGLAPRPDEAERRDQGFLDAQLQNLLIITLVILIIALLVGWRMSRLWLRRVDGIMLGMKRYSQGDFDFRADISGRDELAVLASRLNELGNTLAAGRSARERWMADLSHELRTPLAVLQSQLEAMQDGIRPLTREAVDTLHQQVGRLTTLVGDLHQLTLSDIGALSYHKQPLDLGPWLQQQASLWQPIAQQQGLTLITDLRTSAIVMADESRLSQLLANLLGNAIKYTASPGSVRLSASEAGDRLHIVVEDSAPGLLSDDLERIFEPLYRADSSRSDSLRISAEDTYHGSGLGLSIARRIAEAHKGTLWAEASALGGVSITLSLPFEQREPG